MRIKGYDPVITGLRAYSIAAVLLFHFFHEQLPWLAGYKGVDVFFVISGYLIIGHITKASDEGSFALSTFYAKRIIRLFPALLIMLSAVLAVGYVLLLSEEYRSLAKYVFSSIFFFTNIVAWLEINYFDANAELKPLVHVVAWRRRAVLCIISLYRPRRRAIAAAYGHLPDDTDAAEYAAVPGAVENYAGSDLLPIANAFLGNRYRRPYRHRCSRKQRLAWKTTRSP
ncbi:MAG: acyltransferase [Rhodocyclaceae bacterium]|nr:acyltransferase [Rhodocyclaceae bacterium]